MNPSRPYLLVTGDFVKTGGMDRANHALAETLARRGHEVHLAAFRAEEDLLVRPNVVLHRAAKLAGSYLLSGFLLAAVGKHWASRIARRGGRVIVNGGNCGWSDVNWVHHVHAVDAPQPVGNYLRRLKIDVAYKLARAEESRIVPRAETIITTCRRNRRDIIERLGVDPRRVHVVYYGIDPEHFHPADPQEKTSARRAFGLPARRPLVAFIGEFGDGRKGFDTLFKAWASLCADPNWDADLVTAGTGAQLPAWRAAAAQAGLGSRIHFLGFQKNVPLLLAACDAHVLPSRYEGYSLVTHEALCRGLPAFITASAGIAERYPDNLKDLLIPNPENAEDLARRVRAWRDDAGGYAQRVRPLSDQLRAYTWDHMAEEMIALITDQERR